MFRLMWVVQIRRLQHTPLITLLRILGLVLGVLLSAAGPMFAAAAMQHELERVVAGETFPLSVLVTWTDQQAYDRGLGSEHIPKQVELVRRTLLEQVPARAGFGTASITTLVSTRPVPVRRQDADGRVEALPRYIRLGWIDSVAEPAILSGRQPRPGMAEVTISEDALGRHNWQIGDVLRLSVSVGDAVREEEVTLVGVHARPADNDELMMQWGTLENTLLTTEEYWGQVARPIQEASWHLVLPTSTVRVSMVQPLLQALGDLPGELDQALPGADLFQAPTAWLTTVQLRLVRLEQILMVMLLPAYIVLLIFLATTSATTAQTRHAEVAVLRSRGALIWRVVRNYLPESVLLASISMSLGLPLSLLLSRGMGFVTGFLSFENRSPLVVSLGVREVSYAFLAVALAELMHLAFTLRAVTRTVSDLRKDRMAEQDRSGAVRALLETFLVAAAAYGTWRLRHGVHEADPVPLALPPIAFAVAGIVALRILQGISWITVRVAGRALGPVPYLASTFLRRPDTRAQTLLVMFVLSVAFAIYGSAFARTVERDMELTERYRLGADLVLQPAWEMEILQVDAFGRPVEVAYREPPSERFASLPGVLTQTQVQLRQEVSLFLGNRSLGAVDVIGIEPQTFVQVSSIIPSVTGMDAATIQRELERQPEATIVSQGIATRYNLKTGDLLRLKQQDEEISLRIVGAVRHFPGRLPDDGDFVITRIDSLQERLGLRPYGFWYRLQEGAEARGVVAELVGRKARIQSSGQLAENIDGARQQPTRRIMFAALSIGFLAVVAMMALSYLVGLGQTAAQRTKETAVLQVMGLRWHLIGVAFVVEQVVQVLCGGLVAGSAGLFLSAWYIPILRQTIPTPLRLPVRTGVADVQLIGFLIACVIGIGVIVTVVLLRHLKLTRALRQGEEG